MDSKVPQYQRAVTPTIDSNVSPSLVKGKVLSYNANLIRGGRTNAPDKLYGSLSIGTSASARASNNGGISPRSMSTAGGDGSALRTQSRSGIMYSASAKQQGAEANSDSLAPAFSVLPRFDLIPVSEELPTDGIIFAKTKTLPETLVVFRTPEERLRNPERLNLDRRQLEVCPLLEQEQRLRLLNFQNNSIRAIQNLENLPNLIFLDLYNNKITSLEGPLSTVKGLRVLMAGKNKIASISNLQPLRKLDVLDLHSNEIRSIEGLDGLSDLRVLNLAGNRISTVNNLSSLVSLTELNLRRNNIDCVTGLSQLPALQRVFLSHNAIASVEDIRCLFDVNYLIELSLDGNPLSESDKYRAQLVVGMPGLRHLDLRRVTEEERAAAVVQLSSQAAQPATASTQEEGRADAADDKTTATKPPKSGNVSHAGQHLAVVDYEGGGGDAAGRLRGAGAYSSDESSDGPDDQPSAKEAGAAANRSGARTQSASGEQRKGLQKYIGGATGETKDAVGDAAGTGTKVFNGIAISGSAMEGTPVAGAAGAGTKGAAAGATASSSGLAALARAGKLFNTHSIFDLEIIGPDEKALIAVGDNWEWTPTKRLLLNVTEASLYHMKRQSILAKFGSAQFAAMPALKCLRLVFNDFATLKQVEFIPQLYGKQIEQLIVKNCPLAGSCSPALLRGYFIAAMPRLRAFNEEEVSAKDREAAEKLYGPLVRLQGLVSAEGTQYALQKFPAAAPPPAAPAPAQSAAARAATKAPGSLLRAYQAQVVKSGNSGATAAMARPKRGEQEGEVAAAPVLASSAASVGSVTAEYLRHHAAAGSAWDVSSAGAAVAGIYPAPGVTASGLTARSLARHALQAEFFGVFDAAMRKIVLDSITEL